MGTKELLYGLIGFFIGGLLVAIAANTFNNDELQREPLGTNEVREAPEHSTTTERLLVRF